jgi:hypothetical protein
VSRSRKDGRRGGAHRETQGRDEFWGRRGGHDRSAKQMNRSGKVRTHRLERREGQAEVVREPIHWWQDGDVTY